MYQCTLETENVLIVIPQEFCIYWHSLIRNIMSQDTALLTENKVELVIMKDMLLWRR